MSEPVRFLLVDDVAENLEALEALLVRDGLVLHKARSGPEALELLLVHDFALALLDVQMPDMDGFELAEMMRSTERTRRVPIIFVTAGGADERRTFRGYSTGAVDYLLKPIDPRMLRSKADVFFELARQRQELARQRDALQAGAAQLSEAINRLQAHSDNAPLAIVELDPDLRIVAWSKGAERLFGWSAPEIVGRRATEFGWVCPEDAREFTAVFADMFASLRTRHVHTARNRRKDGTLVDCEWYASALRERSGRPISVNTQILDITARKQAEAAQQLLIGELNHRVKNMLATVQAISAQTLRHSSSPAEFAANFTGRIHSLARVHALLSTETWQGAELTELVESQLRRGAVDATRLTATGPQVRLSPQLALHLALILHELGTNATKYGAISNQVGTIDLTWRVESGVLRIVWAERGGPPVRAPARRGFGTMLIEQSVKAGGGTASASYRADGVTWEMTLALPRATAEPAEPAVEPTPSEEAPLGGARASHRGEVLSGRRFLIVEDEPLVALEMVSILEDAGAVVVGMAGTCEQALHLVESTAADCALLDGNLSDRPVDEVAAAFTRAELPFLFVTGYGRENLPRAFANVPLLTKPFSPNELLAAARALIAPSSEVVPLRSRSRNQQLPNP